MQGLRGARGPLLCGWLGLVLPGVASGQPVDPRSRAVELLSAVDQALSARDSAKADKLLEQAVLKVPPSELALRLMRLAELEGRAVEAVDQKRRYLDLLGDGADGQGRAQLDAQQKALREPVAEVEILGPSGSVLSVDGRVVGVLPLPSPMLLSAKSHRFRIQTGKGRFESDPLELAPQLRAQLHLTPAAAGTAVAILSLSSEWLVLIEPLELEPAQRVQIEQSIGQLAKRERATILPPQRLSRALGAKPPSCLQEAQCQAQVAKELGTRAVVRVRLDRAAGTLHAEWFDVDGGGLAAQRERACGACQGGSLAQAMAALSGELLRDAQNHPRGIVEIDSQPPGATVLLDGQARGVTPYQRALLAGSHALTVALPGYADHHESLVVQGEKTLTVAVQLQPGVSQSLLLDPQRAAVRPKRPLWRFLVGGGLIASGLVVGGLGVSALLRNGQCGDASDPPEGAPCNYLYSTGPVGGGLSGLSLGLTVGGALVMAWPTKASAPYPGK